MRKDKPKRRPSVRPDPSESGRRKQDDPLTDLAYLSRMAGIQEGKESIGDRIRRVREIRGLTVYDLSSRIGIDMDTLERAESGKLVPALGQMVKLSIALHMKMGYFISPGIDKTATTVRKQESLLVSRDGEAKNMLYGCSYESLAPDKANRLMQPFIVALVPTETQKSSTHAGRESCMSSKVKQKCRSGTTSSFSGRGTPSITIPMNLTALDTPVPLQPRFWQSSMPAQYRPRDYHNFP